jgi:hypothetical protein
MSKFTDALNSPLPSKVNTVPVQESATEDPNANKDNKPEGNNKNNLPPEAEQAELEKNTAADGKATTEGCGEEGCAGTEGCIGSECGGAGCGSSATEDSEVGTDDVDDITNSDNDIDPDDMSEEELDALDRELSGNAVDSVVGDDEDEVSLSSDEEMKADDMMNVAATTLLVNDELGVEEKVAFVQNEAETAVAEGFMTDADVNEMSSGLGLVQENSYNKKMIIRLDAASKKKQLYALAVNVSAAAHGDPDYRKLKKVMKMRKVLREKLDRKYKGEATKRMKVYFNRLKHSKSNTLAGIGNKNTN